MSNDHVDSTTSPPLRVEADSCPQIGESCTSALTAEDRCCGGGASGNTQCLYDDVDAFGHELGICCVRDRQAGCHSDADCCGSDAVCHEGSCRRRRQGYGARSISGGFDDMKAVQDVDGGGDGDGVTFMAVSVNTFV